MLTLGIETSSAAGSVALLSDGTLLGESSLDVAGRQHARSLVGEIHRRLKSAGRRPRDCTAVAVSIGPGSFTGLRVGVVAARTLAYATGCRLAAVDTFLAIATNSPADVLAVWVTANAQRGELYVGRYERDGSGDFARMGELSIQPVDVFCQQLHARQTVSGPGADLLPADAVDRATLLPPELRQPRASVIARLGEHDVCAGRTADLWTLEPVYLRRSAAEEKWDQRKLAPDHGEPG
jgi:tRNA threonylcarbamoyladenosine biosynthesis protein TsaB